MGIRKAGVLIPALLGLQIILCWLSSKVNFSISDGFTKWFVYNCPVTRMIEFVFGTVLGYLYLMVGTNTREGNRYHKIVDAVLILDAILLVAALVIFSLANPQDSSMNHPELWWRYTCLFTFLDGVLVFMMALDTGKICRLVSNRVFVFIGGISSNAFLIHQMVIRYGNVLDKFMDIDNLLLNVVCKVIAPFLVTIAFCMLWSSIFYSVNLKFQNKKRS